MPSILNVDTIIDNLEDRGWVCTLTDQISGVYNLKKNGKAVILYTCGLTQDNKISRDLTRALFSHVGDAKQSTKLTLELGQNAQYNFVKLVTSHYNSSLPFRDFYNNYFAEE